MAGGIFIYIYFFLSINVSYNESNFCLINLYIYTFGTMDSI